MDSVVEFTFNPCNIAVKMLHCKPQCICNENETVKHIYDCKSLNIEQVKICYEKFGAELDQAPSQLGMRPI